jgi:hypothetical protein
VYPSLTAEVANQRHAELAAAAAEHRLIELSRQTRPGRGSSRHLHTSRLRLRPFARLAGWVGAGQL